MIVCIKPPIILIDNILIFCDKQCFKKLIIKKLVIVAVPPIIKVLNDPKISEDRTLFIKAIIIDSLKENIYKEYNITILAKPILAFGIYIKTKDDIYLSINDNITENEIRIENKVNFLISNIYILLLYTC